MGGKRLFRGDGRKGCGETFREVSKRSPKGKLPEMAQKGNTKISTKTDAKIASKRGEIHVVLLFLFSLQDLILGRELAHE